MTRGQRGSLLLHCGALASPTPRRFIPALSDSHRFSCRTIVGNKGISRTSIGWQSPIFARAQFCYGLLAPRREKALQPLEAFAGEHALDDLHLVIQ